MAIIFVNDDARGLNDGTSWANAYTDLQIAIEQAQANDQIWVARGTYKPTSDANRDISFAIKNGVEIYGGFVGNEPSDEANIANSITGRNIRNNPTILSGDIGDVGDKSDNSYHVVRIDDTSITTILDGFIITGGQADVSSAGRNIGAGIYNARGGDATLRNLIVTDNFASESGAGFYNNSSNPTLTNIIFRNNFANNFGGAIFNRQGGGEITNALFLNNESQSGGAIYNSFADTTITNSTFYNNRADEVGAILTFQAPTKIENSIFWENAGGDGNQILTERSNATNIATVNNSIVQDDYDGPGNNISDDDPLFVNPAAEDFRLSNNSPALNAGNNDLVSIETDLARNSRIVADIVDLGAYEGISQPPVPLFPQATQKIIFVDQDAEGSDDGTSWEDAYNDLQDAIASSQAGDTIWVAEGTYKPTQDANRDASFELKNFVDIYGGFAGGETRFEQRDWQNNVTILSGNIGSDQAQTDNSYHVVRIDNTSNTTILDGFTITGGQADVSSAGRNIGAGIYNRSGGDATLRNLIVTDNFASDRGAGFYTNSSNPTLTNIIFRNNFANNFGGAIFNRQGGGEITNTLFLNNESQSGGAIYNSFADTTITNSTFYNNRADEAGAILTFQAPTKIENSIFWENAGGDGNQILTERSNATNIATVNNSIVQGGYTGPGSNNLTDTPLFFDLENGDLRLRPDSPGVDDIGNNRAIEEDTDLLGNVRIFNSTVDVGAYEYGLLLSIDDVTLAEGNAATTDAVFTVTLLDSLDQPSTREVTVDYTTVNDTASAGDDFNAVNGTLTFAAEETTKTIRVPVIGDTNLESDKTFLVNLSNPTNAAIVDGQGVGLIEDDDEPAKISIGDRTIVEGNTDTQTVTFTISLDEARTQPITVDYTTVDGTAFAETENPDYTATSGTLTFAPGETETTVSVVVQGDNFFEADETFSLELNNPSENAEIETNLGTATIENDDLPKLAISDVSQAEGDNGTNAFLFNVTLSGASNETITVDYATQNNTALAGEDYTAQEGTLTFAPGEIEQTISVLVEGDINFEADETFSVRLSNSSENAEIRGSEGIGTINNDDPELGTIELFRFRNTTFDTGTYVFVGEGERDAILANPDLSNVFSLDGRNDDGSINPAFVASLTPNEDLIPFFRLESLSVLGTFLFVSTGEYEAIFAEDSNQKDLWKKQGFDENNNDIPEFYLLPPSSDSGIPFNRYQNLNNNTFLYAGPGESAAIDGDPNLSNVFLLQGGAFNSLT